MEMTVLSVKFPRVAEEMVSDGVYSAVVSDILCYTVFVDGQAVSAPVHYKLPTQVTYKPNRILTPSLLLPACLTKMLVLSQYCLVMTIVMRLPGGAFR